MSVDYSAALPGFFAWLQATGKAPATASQWHGMARRISAALGEDTSLVRLDEFVASLSLSQRAIARTSWRKFCEYLRADPDLLGLPAPEAPPHGKSGRTQRKVTHRDLLLAYILNQNVPAEVVAAMRWGFVRRHDAHSAAVTFPAALGMKPLLLPHTFFGVCRQVNFPGVRVPPETAPLFPTELNGLIPLSDWRVALYARLAQTAISSGNAIAWVPPTTLDMPGEFT
jgi:hypothetical protein